VFDTLKSKYLTKQYKTLQHKIEQYMTNFYGIDQYFTLYDVWWTKRYFNILDNLYLRQKIMLWFSQSKISSFCLILYSQFIQSLKQFYSQTH